jgi:dGTPase
MTYSTLASIVKYPFPSIAATKAKFGFFVSEREHYETVAKELGIPQLNATRGQERWARYPLVYLVEAADDICYEIMDLEDAFKLKILSFDETASMMLNFFDETEQN